MKQNKPQKQARNAKPAKKAQPLKKGKPQASKKQAADKQLHKGFISALQAHASELDAIASKYVTHLVDPQHTEMVGVPLQVNGINQTGLVQSIMSFDVSAVGTNDDASGRFGLVVNPTLGDGSSPHRYKVALANQTWPSDFSASTSFTATSGTTDLTTDPNSSTLLQGPAIYIATSNATDQALTDPIGMTSGSFAYDATTSNQYNPSLGATGVWTLGTFAGLVADVLTLPPGQYNFSFEAYFVGANAPPAQLLVGVDDADLAFVSIQEEDLDANTYVTNMVLSVYEEAQRFYFYWETTPPLQAGHSETVITTSWARPDKLVNPAPGYPLDGGLVRNYTPVAMSCLVTCMAPELTIAGDIACAWVSPDSCAADIFTPAPRASVGQLLMVENLRKVPMAYDGKVRHGCYQIWRPSTMEDCVMRKPSQNAARDWPCLVVAGKANGIPTASTQLMVRVIVCTTYQFNTDIICFPLSRRVGSTAALEEALRLLMTFPLASANGTHLENLRNFFKKIRGIFGKAVDFYNENASWIDPAVKVGAQALMAI